ncbi:MAG TPA: DUF349 domain-containing protein [Vicinamibacterales bacterium]
MDKPERVMTLLDRFRAQPPQKHTDPVVRLAYVQEIPIDERDLLAEIARDDVDARVRRAAVGKLMDPPALATVADADPDPGVRDAALTMLRDIALDSFEGLAEAESLAAVEALSDSRMLATVAKTALREEVALRALGRVGEAHALGSIARHAQLEPIRLAALSALQDRGELLSVALNSDFKDTGVAAVDRLDDRRDLEQIAARGKNKSALKRARTILREMDERAAAESAAQTQTAGLNPPVASEAVELTPEERAEEAARQEEAARVAAEAARVRAELQERAARQREEDQAARERDEEEARQRREEQAARQREEEQAARQRAEEQARQQHAERAEALAREARVRQESLVRLTHLAARIESFAGKADLTLKAGERALRDVRTALADLPPLPSKREHDELEQRLKNIQTTLAAKVQELRELTEWKRWANLGVQEQLCAKMEGLSSLDDPPEIARQVRALQAQWREASDVPRPQGDVLWRRFKAAHDVVWARCAAYFAAENQARAENLARKITLCEKAEALADSTRWIQTAEEIKRLQLEWKTVGVVTRGQEKMIWERFRSACDRFFTRRHADLAEHKKRWAENMGKKEALCVQVEALADSTNWDATASEIRRLQNEWKTVGPVKKSRSEAIWQRFRGACDRFFTRYSQRHEIARGERVAAREAICAELESLAPSPDTNEPASASHAPPQELLATVRGLRARWQQEIAARGVDRERATALDQRFAAAFARVLAAAPAAFAGSDLDPDANRKRMEGLVRRMEELANSAAPSGGEAGDAALSPTTRLAEMLREALAANTIGGKVDEESRMRAAAEEVRQAQASWARIGPVPDDVRRALTDRFARACRRITDRAAGAGRAGGAGGSRPSRPS